MNALFKLLNMLGFNFTESNKPTSLNTSVNNNTMSTSTIDDQTKKLIQGIVNIFETGTFKGDYSEISIYNDGKNRTRQITYGRSQTTEQSNLKDLVSSYIQNNGQYANDLKPYLTKIGVTSLVGDSDFITLLKNAGKDPIMVKTQDDFFDKDYYQRAQKFFEDNGFTQPLSMLVIYDSYIHSGGILDFLREKFSTLVPAKGGDEKSWIIEYVNVRYLWLLNHSNPILRNTVYRPRLFKDLITKNDWDLKQLPINVHGTTVSEADLKS